MPSKRLLAKIRDLKAGLLYRTRNYGGVSAVVGVFASNIASESAYDSIVRALHDEDQ